MKKFRFRLERILQYRQAVEAELKRELMLANNKLNLAKEILKELEQAQIKNTISDAQLLDVNEFVMRGMYSARLKEEIFKQHEAIAKAEKVVEEVHARYVEAAKEAKALEKLKVKKKSDYLEYVEKEEGKFLDEIVTQRSSRTKQQRT